MPSSAIPQWESVIILCAANNYDYVKLGDQHISNELSKITPVLYIDPPISVMTPLKNTQMARQLAGPRLRLQSENLARLTPVVEPLPSKAALTRLTATALRRYIRWAVARLGVPRVSALISAWPQYSVFNACESDLSVYWAQDDFVGGASLLGLNPRHLDKCEQRVATAADFVVASSPLVADTWRNRGRDVTLIPYGADLSAYAKVDSASWPADVDLPDPIVGFVGHINRRIDIRMFEEIAARGHSLLLIGPKDPAFETARFSRLIERENVRWLGFKPFNELASYYRRIAVGIVPYGDGAFNRGSFPLKTLEYLAAGKPAVSTDLPATRWLSTDLVAIASGAGPFADMVEVKIAEADDQTLIARRKQFAARHTWEIRASTFYEAIQKHDRTR